MLISFQAIVRNQEEFSCMIATQAENIPRNICQDVLPCKLTLTCRIQAQNPHQRKVAILW